MSDEIQNNDKEEEKKKKKFYVPRNDRSTYEKSAVIPLWGRNYNKPSVGSKFTNTQLIKYLTDPYGNYQALQNASNYFWSTSAFYQNIIYYFATIMTYDVMITPSDMTNNETTMMNRLLGAAKSIKGMNVKSTFPHLIGRTLVQGETYWYDFADNDNYSCLQEIPCKYCQLAYIDDKTGIWRYYVNLSLLTDQYVFELPQEIVDAYERYKKLDRSKQKEKSLHPELGILVENNMYLVSQRGFSMFVHKNKVQHDYPFFASMFADINTLEDNKDYIDEYLKESNLKLIHQKIPTDDNGEPLMDETDVRIYHESAKEHLPSSTAPLTNPFEVQALNFDSVQSSAINVFENSQKTVQFDSGVSSTLFESNTTNGLQYSIQVDASKMYGLLSFLESYMNLKITSNKMKTTILTIHQYNRLEWHKQYASDLAIGGSRMLFLVSSGIDLYDSLMTAKMEKLIDIDQYLPIKANANQMSASSSQDNGRPAKDSADKSDSTVTGDGYE